MVREADVDLLHDLEGEVEKLLERHYNSTKMWHPHTMVPWSRGRDFEADYEWSADDANVPPEVRSALFVNLLTEDNLPYYFRDIERMFGEEGPWGEWTRRWTAEEARHAAVIRDYLTVTRAIDPVALEEGRMVQMCGGMVPRPPSAIDGLVYVTLQELATRISHRNTGALLDDRAGYDIMRRVAIDENFHFLFYRDAASAALEIDPSETVRAMERQVIGFAMPGEGIPDFVEHAKVIANAGIYNLSVHYEQILEPIVLRHWNLAGLGGLDGEAEQARDRVMAYIAKSERVANRLKARMEARQAEAAENGSGPTGSAVSAEA
jgi:acyl-[acyl-carrier-protein] desaturase